VVVLQLSLTLLLAWRGSLPALVLPALINAVLLGALALFGHHTLALFGVSLPLVLLMVITRAFAYGMVKPASDALYTCVSRVARYKGKSFIETTVWRFGDVLVTSAVNVLRDLGLGVAAIASIAGGAACAARSSDLAPDTPRARRAPAPDQPAM
jgi:AAA family ATP:ADP antiporter